MRQSIVWSRASSDGADIRRRRARANTPGARTHARERERPSRRSLRLAGVALATIALLFTACRGPRTAPRPVSATPPELFGWVLRVEGTDTVPAPSARVWTEPASDAVTTTGEGYWAISAGLVPGPYRVLAEFEGVSGRSQRLTARLGRSDTVVVLIGASDTPWPPALAFVNKLPKATRGPAVIR